MKRPEIVVFENGLICDIWHWSFEWKGMFEVHSTDDANIKTKEEAERLANEAVDLFMRVSQPS